MASTDFGNFRESTRMYESWLGSQLNLLEEDLAYKHEQMKAAPFPFLRATFYRWVQTWPAVCADLHAAPAVLAVGDLHVENFGTWRDAEGRLVWGTNDFDEAYELPFTADLVRLATSAVIAADARELTISPKAACEAISAGYVDALRSGGAAFVLEEQHGWLRKIANNELRSPDRFWEKMRKLPTAAKVPESAAAVLRRALPESGELLRIATRRAGLGSLGRERYVALMDWAGGMIAREAKALTSSACVFARYGDNTGIRYSEVLERAVRSRDPFVGVDDGWILRRLAPHCTRIELAAVPGEKDEVKLLHAMGWETANVHLGSAEPRTLKAYIASLPADWLPRAAKHMRDQVMKDWEEFRT
jgi:hypothetical protein